MKRLSLLLKIELISSALIVLLIVLKLSGMRAMGLPLTVVVTSLALYLMALGYNIVNGIGITKAASFEKEMITKFENGLERTRHTGQRLFFIPISLLLLAILYKIQVWGNSSVSTLALLFSAAFLSLWFVLFIRKKNTAVLNSIAVRILFWGLIFLSLSSLSRIDLMEIYYPHNPKYVESLKEQWEIEESIDKNEKLYTSQDLVKARAKTNSIRKGMFIK